MDKDFGDAAKLVPPQLQHVCFQTHKSWESTHHSCLSESCSKADNAEILALAKKTSGEEGVTWLGMNGTSLLLELEEANKSLISQAVLERERDHMADFTPEVTIPCLW